MAEKSVLDIIVEYKQYLGLAFILLGLVIIFWVGDLKIGMGSLAIGLIYTLIYWQLKVRRVVD